MTTATKLNDPAPDADRRRLPYLVAVVAAMAALLWTLAAQDPWGWLLPGRVGIEIDRQVYLVPERHLSRLSKSRPDWLSDAEEQALERMEQGMSRELDRLVRAGARPRARVRGLVLLHDRRHPAPDRRHPEPVRGHRERCSHRRRHGSSVPEEAWQAELVALDRAVVDLYGRELAALEDRWLAWLARELAPYRRDEPLPPGQASIDFNQRVQAHVAEILETDRIGIQAAAGLGAGALLARGAIARVNARVASARAAARLGGRGTAASGAAACGVSGPLAIGCGVVVFTGITLGTEWALLRADEALNREALEQAMHQGVDALRASMMKAYGQELLGGFEADLGTLAAGVRAACAPSTGFAGRMPGRPAPCRRVPRPTDPRRGCRVQTARIRIQSGSAADPGCRGPDAGTPLATASDG
jgi:hypothetical protein